MRAGRVDVRTAAEVDEVAVLVCRDRRRRLAPLARCAAQVVDDLDLVGLAGSLEEGAPSSAPTRSLEGVVGGDGGGHARLDGAEVLRGQGPRQLEVVVEAALDGRTDAEARARKEVQTASAMTCAAEWRMGSSGSWASASRSSSAEPFRATWKSASGAASAASLAWIGVVVCAHVRSVPSGKDSL